MLASAEMDFLLGRVDEKLQASRTLLHGYIDDQLHAMRESIVADLHTFIHVSDEEAEEEMNQEEWEEEWAEECPAVSGAFAMQTVSHPQTPPLGHMVGRYLHPSLRWATLLGRYQQPLVRRHLATLLGHYLQSLVCRHLRWATLLRRYRQSLFRRHFCGATFLGCNLQTLGLLPREHLGKDL